jgi:hypothetical protein
MQIVYVNDTVLVEAEKVLLFFVFSLLYSIAHTVLTVKAMNSALRYIIHFIICVFGFYACFLLPIDNMRESYMVTGIVIFINVYLTVMGIRALFVSRLRSNREQGATYEKQFKKAKK